MKSWLIGKDSDAGRDWGQEEKGTTEDEMAGWHHQLDGHEFEWTPGVGDGQGGLACCNSWGHRESDTTERLNWTELKGSWWIINGYRDWVLTVFRCYSITKLCPTLCNPMDCSLPGSCPSLSPRIRSNSCPLSQCCYLIVSSFVAPFSFCLQSSPGSGSFPMSWLFASGSQGIGASASVLPMNI